VYNQFNDDFPNTHYQITFYLIAGCLMPSLPNPVMINTMGLVSVLFNPVMCKSITTIVMVMEEKQTHKRGLIMVHELQLKWQVASQ